MAKSVVTGAVILAGGLGTRLRGVIADIPKPMAPINGRPFLEYQLDYWISQGIREVVLSVGYRRDAIINHFGTTYRGIAIRYAVEEEPMGTGGGLLLGAAELSSDSPFLVLNGDTFFEVPLAALSAFHCDRRADWTISLFRAREPGRYMGVRVEEDGRIASVCSETRAEPGTLANGGVYLVEPHVMAASGFAAGMKASLEDDILVALQQKKARLYGFECSGRFIDIGLPRDYLRAGEIVTGVRS